MCQLNGRVSFWKEGFTLLVYSLTYLLTYSMDLSPSWKVNGFSAGQEIPHILWNHLQVPASRPFPEAARASPFYHVPLPEIHFNIILLTIPWFSKCLFPSTNTLYTSLLSPIRATCPAYFILLDLLTQNIFGEQFRSLSSSLCSFLHSPVISSLLRPNIPISTLFSNTLSPHFSLNLSDQVSLPYRTTSKIIVLYILLFAGPCGRAV